VPVTDTKVDCIYAVSQPGEETLLRAGVVHGVMNGSHPGGESRLDFFEPNQIGGFLLPGNRSWAFNCSSVKSD
jgi:hypothetical protein